MTLKSLAYSILSKFRYFVTFSLKNPSPSHFVFNLKRLFISPNKHKSSIVSYPRHPIALYVDYLQRLVSFQRCRFFTLHEQITAGKSFENFINIVLRHDIDAGTPEICMALCEVEEKLNLRSTVHILVDGSIYPPDAMKSAAIRLHEMGFDVGLHTQAWMTSNYAQVFNDEITKFTELFGFPPKTFTFHGAWPRTAADLQRRKVFESEIEVHIKNTSIVGYSNQYDWIAEDSSVNAQPAPIKEQFFQLTNQCMLGQWALILTHDNHWKING